MYQDRNKNKKSAFNSRGLFFTTYNCYLQGVGVEMERLAARMGGTRKWAYNNSECLDADFFKVIQDSEDSKCTQRKPKIYTMLHNCVDYANFTITTILLRLKNILY